MRTAYLVTGARALEAVPSSAQWGRDVLHAAIAALPRGSVVVTGDAQGPDAWARDSARCLGVAVRIYTKHGRVTDADGRVTSQWRSPVCLPQPPETWTERLLARDLAEVVAVARLASDGTWLARGIALYAPWSRTAGTAYTARRAAAHAIVVAEHTCPADLAPVTP